MKLKSSVTALLVVCSICLTLYAQETTGPRPKRARTPEDYQRGTLKELAAKAASAENRNDETMVVDPDLSPTRVRATYAERTARTSEAKAKLISEWARRYAGAPDTYTPYEVDVAFTENGSHYWLTFRKKTLTSFFDSGNLNKPVDLFVIKMGAIKQGDNWVPVLLVESFSNGSSAANAKTINHYVFFGMDREKLKDAAAFLETRGFAGAQISYSWRQLEPGKDEYDFSLIREDLQFLSSKGKKLFVQIQDVSFSEKWIHVPHYLLKDAQYGGGADKQYRYKHVDHRETDVKVLGWMARRWDENVRARFKKLLVELGKEFDGKIEGVNLAETAYDIGNTGALFPKDFTFEKYRDGIIANMKALREAFPKSVVLVYANFMPGEWLPTEDKGYLRAVYQAAKEMDVGVGGPDLLPHKRSQMNHSYPLIRSSSAHVRVGIAVQDGDYQHLNPQTGKEVTIAEIIAFGTDYLGVDYIFWCTEEPFFSERLIRFMKSNAKE